MYRVKISDKRQSVLREAQHENDNKSTSRERDESRWSLTSKPREQLVTTVTSGSRQSNAWAAATRTNLNSAAAAATLLVTVLYWYHRLSNQEHI